MREERKWVVRYLICLLVLVGCASTPPLRVERRVVVVITMDQAREYNFLKETKEVDNLFDTVMGTEGK